ncbi:malate dehydrogenase 1, mitochondrial-like [Fagus crenata]
MVYAGAIFADACLKGLNGVPDVVECSYVQSNITELPFFASQVINLNSLYIFIGLYFAYIYAHLSSVFFFNY